MYEEADIKQKAGLKLDQSSHKNLNILVLHHFINHQKPISPANQKIATVFRQAEFEINWQQATTEAEYQACLQQPIDLILWDAQQARIELYQAIDLLSQANFSIPLLVINGDFSIRKAIATIKAGATDYLAIEEIDSLPTVALNAISQPNICSQLAQSTAQTQQQLRKLITENADGIIVVDEKGIVQFINPAALKIFARPKESLINHPLGFPVVNGDYLEVDIPQGEEQNIVAQMRVSQIQWQGKNAYVVSLRDITLLKQVEEERAKLLTEAQAANRAKDEFLAVLSHELRTPLNPIFGWSQIIARGNLSQAQVKEGAKIIQRNAELQTQLIEDILDISKIIRGELKLKVTSVDLAATIHNALETVELSAIAKSIKIHADIATNVGLIKGDATRLQQVVWNLLSNAIKFTPNGGEVTISLSSVQKPDQNSSQVMIQVKDTGKGIDAEFLPYVFDYFRQAENASTRSKGGLGLGLAIARRLIELHGGEITAASPGLNQGATFTILLPIANRAFTRLLSKNSSPSRKSSLADTSILVVDDDDGSRELLIFVLQIEGATIKGVASADQALEEIATFQPDILISDLVMPQIDGYELIKRARAIPSIKNFKAIALSAYTSEQARQKSLTAGFDYHVNKPLNITNFVKVVTQIEVNC